MVAAAAVLWAFDASIADFKLDDPCTVDLLVVDGRIGLLASDVIRLFARLDLLTSGNERPASLEQFDLTCKIGVAARGTPKAELHVFMPM